MNDETKGIRALPPALLLAFAGWFALTAARVIWWLGASEPWRSVRLTLALDAGVFACEVLALYGSFELARRLGGRAAIGIRIAAWAFVGVLAMDGVYTAASFAERFWEHETLLQVMQYAYYAAWLAVVIGVCVACGRARRLLGIAIVIVSVLTWPPPFLQKTMYGWLPGGKTGLALDGILHGVRYALLLAGFAAVARGTAVMNPGMAATGLRLAARSLWLRLLAAVIVPLITLMMIAGKSGRGGLELLRVATLAALVINIIAFTQFGIGALRAARGSVVELGRWRLALGAAASLWAGGVVLAQTPWVYKSLYKPDSLVFSRAELQVYSEAFSVAMPIVYIAGMGLIIIAILGLAARRGNAELSGHAQSKGAAFVTLSLVALAITAWMLPGAMRKSSSLGSPVMLILLALGSAVVALVMLARLLNLGAGELEREPGLPTATVVES
jgi:hypothetical protein